MARRDGVRGIADLLAKGGDAGVAGEREEHQPASLEDPPEPPPVSGPMVDTEGLAVSDAANTVASEARTTATMIRVSHAVFCTPSKLTAVSPTTAPIASGRARPGLA